MTSRAFLWPNNPANSSSTRSGNCGQRQQDNRRGRFGHGGEQTDATSEPAAATTVANEQIVTAEVADEGTFTKSEELSEAGYAKVRREQLKDNRRFDCSRGLAWKRRPKLAVDRRPELPSNLPCTTTCNEPSLTFSSTTQRSPMKTENLHLKRVPPDAVITYVYRSIVLVEDESSMTSTSAHSKPVTLKPGETVTVDLGGSGRPVIGKLVPPADYKKPITEWNHGSKSVIPSDATADHYGFRIEHDGNFRIEDLAAGDYELSVSINSARPEPSSPFFCPRIDGVADPSYKLATDRDP